MKAINLTTCIKDLIRRGLTQQEIADFVGVQQPAISKLLNGERKDMRYAHAEKLVELHRRTMAKKAA